MRKRDNAFRSMVARVMTLVMAAVMISGSMSVIPARAEGSIYPYMIFASSVEEGAVTIYANNTGINGNVATNGTIAGTGGNCNINGTRTERAGEDTESGQVTGDPLLMPDIRERIVNTYFEAGTQEHVGDYALEEININVDTPIEGNGKVSLSGNINLNAGIMAQEDIVLDGEVKNSGDVVLYSVSGNVIIDSGNVNLNGLVYAPYGEIRIISMNVNMNNVILIAQKVTIEANGVNGGMNQGMAQFIGTEYDVIGDGTGNDPEELMQGIIRYEATEGLEDIGEAYFKDIMSLDDIGYTIEGFPCVKNQLLLTSKEGIAFSQIEELAHSYDAEIVGYLELTDDYQIEFYEEITPERLRFLREELGQNELIERCDYNLSAEIDCDFHTNDAEWNNPSSGQSPSWNSAQPGGNNWNVESIDLEGALVNAGVISANVANADFSDLSGLTTVKIGLIDSAFDLWHEDLNYVTVWNNYSSPVDIRTAASLTGGIYHGNHVAGIMAAEYNNGKGITGICPKHLLYGFSLYGNTLSYAAMERDSTMKLQYALDLLIGNHVKVINYSRGNDTNAFAASQNERYAIDFLEERTDKIDEFLVRLINKGYDFLIVTSSGNANNDQFYKYFNKNGQERYVSVLDYSLSNSPEYDYGKVETTITYGAPNSQATVSCNEVDAKYNNAFSYSRDSRVQERVIVVGAIEKPVGNTGTYNVANFSNTGSRVNILAPGYEILSCMISGMGADYDYKQGTSMAAPHVSGVAGLAWNVNPDISAPELKDIILNNYQVTIDGYAVLNAADVIAAVVQYKAPEEDEEYTVQLRVTDADGNRINEALVEVHDRSFYWCKVLGAAMRNDAVGSTIVCSGKTDIDGNIKLNIPQGRYYVLVDGGNGGVLEEIIVSSEDIIERSVKEITILDYQTDETRGIILQLSSSAVGENVNPYGLIMNAEIRFIKGWIDTFDKEDIRIEDYVREEELMADGGESVAVFPVRDDFGDIDAHLPEGIYTVEVTLPDAEPQYYHIIISDKYDFTFYRFDM